MEKSIFLFRRNPNRNPQEFYDHYINNHAILGKRLTKCLLGYTVNLTGGDGYPAAVTEHWVPSVMDLLTPAIAYATMEDFNLVLADDQSLFSGFELYVVKGENVLLDGAIPAAPLDEMTPGFKLIESLSAFADLPPTQAGAVRVVDNLVSHKLEMTDDFKWIEVDAGVDVIRMSWFEQGADIAKSGENGWVTQEYRFIAPPAWPE